MFRISFIEIVVAVLGSLLAVPVQAAITRTYVASTGLDANTTFSCDFAHPCRTFQTAFSQTTTGGEILAVDGSGYGPITIDRSVSIIANPGAFAGIGVFVSSNGNSSGVYINTAGVIVVLRGLTINGLGGDYGIYMTDGAKLSIENCVIANLMTSGVLVNTAAIVRVTDTMIRDNGGFGLQLRDGTRATVTRATISGNSDTGVFVSVSAAGITTTADIADSTVDGNTHGVYAKSTNGTAVLKVSVRGSQVVRNLANGLATESQVGGANTLSVSNNIVSNNGTGILGLSLLPGGSTVWASGNTVSDNGTGLQNNSGLFESAGNNAVRNNGTNVTGTITPIATM